MRTPSERSDLPVLYGTKNLAEVAKGYQRVLKANPRHSESLVGMCLVALASGQNDAAVRMAEAAIEASVGAAPGIAFAYVAHGQALKACGRKVEAEGAYMKALSLGGAHALAWLGLG
jgi:Flp pilus assembly protein TadD